MERPICVPVRRRLLVALALLLAALAAPPVARVQSPPLTDARLFDDTVLQRVDLQVNAKDWDTLRERYTANTYYPATFVWGGQTVRNVGIRSRGSGTRSGVKPGLLIDFNRYVSGQTFLGLKSLVLDNHLQDGSAMREALTMAILVKLGLPAPREALAQVHINGEFFGVYTLVENIDSVSTKRLFPQPASAKTLAATAPPNAPVKGMARLRRDPPNPVPSPTVPAPSPVPEQPTGYLFEYKWLDYYYATYLGFDLDPYAAILEAKTHEDEPRETLYRPIEQLFREINEAPDDGFVERVSPHLDLRSYVQIIAVQVFMADYDAIAGDFGLNNFYLYRPAGGGPHKFVPWDEDNAFHSVDYDVNGAQEKHVLVRRAMQAPELRRLYLDTLERVAQLIEAREAGQSANWLEREIARRHDLMAAMMRQDRVKPYSDADFEREVAVNVDFARRRAVVVRQQLQSSLR